ncbi:MAG: UTP--glucose-1-phosphate uridylyltransferase, partial [Notoacmeibacter sp.]
ANADKGQGGEIQLTDSMLKLMGDQRFTGVKYEGRSFDCGSREGFVTANLAFALDRSDMRDAISTEISKHFNLKV